ncbi:ash family protein [Escherichia coli]|uniref:ash family protein n=1 Tax=Escherichia coli TaxID=562 RepID=UPI00191C6F43
MRFSEIAAVYLHAFNKMLVSGTHTQWKLVDLQPDLFTVVFDSVVHELKHNKMVMFAQYIDSAISGRYTVPAPYKAGAGRGNPKFNIEHNRAHAVFSCHEHCYAQIMVGRAGPTSVGPGSMLTGISTPVRLTTYMVVESLGGEFFEFNIGAVTMTTTTTHPFLKIEIINGKTVIFSLHVACHFKRMHQNIVDKIEYLNCSREFFTRNFIPGTYHIYGDSLRGYYITLDGLMMLQLGLSLRTMRYYESCIEAFHETEASLSHTAFRRNQWEVRP